MLEGGTTPAEGERAGGFVWCPGGFDLGLFWVVNRVLEVVSGDFWVRLVISWFSAISDQLSAVGRREEAVRRRP